MTVSNFQFLNPYLVSLNFKTNVTAESIDETYQMENSIQVDVKRDPSKNQATVLLTLKVNPHDQSPFTITATIASDFRWDDLNDDAVNAMLNQNAPSLLLSYLRPIIASVTNASVFPPYNIPFMNFANLPKNE